ncbi:FMN-binding negative transcriptional regulator [Planomonospora venezuelensis]|uniref:Transcriptional regulator n=1 Tax=Planomonospora venezuelensis TaxID=1999 RepID=A0A841D2K9_PLAVE|nr:FMN-binding negative transcriptional regulator [Planomonospora venezuelensis]MBB5964020.1 transcriptional regulator [Planomonospora venezuelensis]GIM99642.1 transcriptional regulator [Planomonospora venezuelensis]
MLIHPWDAATEDEALAFVRANEFGHLIAAGRDREVPVVVPTQFLLAGDRTVLLHLARPNPIWAAIEENPAVLLSVAGDWAYVPGSWKVLPGEGDPRLGVPTTYYAAVQLVCRAEIVTDAEGKAEILRAQIGRLEPEGALADPVEHERRFAGIRGLRLTVQKVDGKFKYGGNVDAEHRRYAAERLAERGGPGDAAARAHLVRRLEG